MSERLAWIGRIAGHPQLANLIMLLMLLSGFLAVKSLNTQYMPTFSLNEVDISVDWPGASTQELESGIVIPVEKALTGMAHSTGIESVLRTGQTTISVEFDNTVDLQDALNRVRNRVDTVKNWPPLAEKPIVSIADEFEPVLQLSLTGPDWMSLRQMALEYEQILLDLGIARVEKLGLADLELQIVPKLNLLQQHQLSFRQLAEQVEQLSQDYPAGELDQGEQLIKLRLPVKPRSLEAYAQLPIRLPDGSQLALSELAELAYQPARDQPLAFPNGQSGIVLALYRFGDSSMVAAAETVESWVAEMQSELPNGVELVVHNPTWRQISERLNLLLQNGALGLLLILMVLYLFLNRQIAFWVALGIPTAFAATLGMLWLMGGSLNVISLFAMLMALGVIVDDSVVVGEAVFSRLKGNTPLQAVVLGSSKMFQPVLFSSLTTVAAFLPLLLITDTIGAILFSIPLVMIAMLIASMLECFSVLPNHLLESLKRSEDRTEPEWKQRFQAGFERFKTQRLLPMVRFGIQHTYMMVVGAFLFLGSSLYLVNSGAVGFDFFPADNNRVVVAAVKLSPELNEQRKLQQLEQLKIALQQTDQEAGGIVLHQVHYLNGRYLGEEGVSTEPGTVSIAAELVAPEQRDVDNRRFKQLWTAALSASPDVLSITISELSDGPPDADIALEVTGADYETLKQTAEEIKQYLAQFPALTNIDDNLPWGKPEYQLQLSEKARQLGLNEASLAQQLYDYLIGFTAQRFYLEADEVEVKISAEAAYRDVAALSSLPIALPNNQQISLQEAAKIDFRPGFDSLVRFDGRSAIQVSANVDKAAINEVWLQEKLETELLPQLQEKYGVEIEAGGMEEREERTFSDLLSGLFLALFLIYALLVLFCQSWIWPIMIMLAIPLGISSAVFGHWLLGINMTLFSLFGFFGLAGILINGVIILIAQYREYRTLDATAAWAMELACEKRIRPVFITTLTTIAGLLPILFSGSEQAMFLKPLAVSIVFGLLFGSLLILVLIPSLVVRMDR